MGALAREGGNKIRNLRRGESQCPLSSDTLFSNSLARALLPPWELRHGPPANDDGGLLLLLSSTAHASKQVHSRDSLFSLFLSLPLKTFCHRRQRRRQRLRHLRRRQDPHSLAGRRPRHHLRVHWRTRARPHDQ